VKHFDKFARTNRLLSVPDERQAGVPLLDEDYLILSTIHSAKGQEWKMVFVLNVVDGCLPSDLGTGMSAEEDRRLLYVANVPVALGAPSMRKEPLRHN
jgi:superfamily I DNA/RNA helicase